MFIDASDSNPFMTSDFGHVDSPNMYVIFIPTVDADGNYAPPVSYGSATTLKVIEVTTFMAPDGNFYHVSKVEAIDDASNSYSTYVSNHLLKRVRPTTS